MAGETIRRMGFAAAIAAALLSACSQESPPTAIKVAPKFHAPAAAINGPSAEELTAGMVQAAAQGKAPLPLDVKFDLSARPAVGKTLEVNLALIAQASGGPATVSLTGIEGFEGIDNAKYVIEELKSGEVYRHTLQVTPNTDGVLLLGLNVSFKHDEIADSKDFSIPVIVGR